MDEDGAITLTLSTTYYPPAPPPRNRTANTSFDKDKFSGSETAGANRAEQGRI